MKYITMLDIAREAGLATLPPYGGWVCIKGCPAYRRGKRIIPAHREIGIRHLDIYWGYQEKVVHQLRVNRLRRRRLELVRAVYYDVSQGATPDEALHRVAEELRAYVQNSPQRHPEWQNTVITVSHPHPEEVRFYNSEVMVFEQDFIRRLLEANYIMPISFGESSVPVLEDAAQEIVDALRVDGLSEAEAYHMVVTAGVAEPTEKPFTPTWYYRPINEFRDTFVEEAYE